MTRPRDFLPPAAAALLVVPYLTLALPFRQALVVQAAAILTVTAGLGLLGLAAGGFRQRLQSTKATLWVGGALWTAATIAGLASALAAGHSRMRIAGQLLALGLLPLGLVAGRLARASERRFQAVGWALVVVSLAACLLHFGVWAVGAHKGLAPRRLYLENSVSMAGALPMVLVLLLTLRPIPR
ncbi:MAG: hypothetical protein KDD47_10190, partial [Acidobacteria bacterium]|nr:hypothetical protein [Acidobacteriota bacterium]